jgi:hypothetical protein
LSGFYILFSTTYGSGGSDSTRVSPATIAAPEADLFDTTGRKIGKHYAGPHWASTVGSKIAGTIKERADAPQADAMPWWLLVTKSVGSQGSFSRITSIQRVSTVGGVELKPLVPNLL